MGFQDDLLGMLGGCVSRYARGTGKSKQRLSLIHRHCEEMYEWVVDLGRTELERSWESLRVQAMHAVRHRARARHMAEPTNFATTLATISGIIAPIVTDMEDDAITY
jgi:hypothetical protein